MLRFGASEAAKVCRRSPTIDRILIIFHIDTYMRREGFEKMNLLSQVSSPKRKRHLHLALFRCVKDYALLRENC